MMNKVKVIASALFLGALALSEMAIAAGSGAQHAKRGAADVSKTPDDLPPPPPPPPKNADDALITTISTMKSRVEEYYTEHHAWPSSLEQINLADHNDAPGAMMQSETLGPDGVITATFRSDVREVGGKSLLISPVVQPDGTFIWKCSAKDLSLSDFPETCGP